MFNICPWGCNAKVLYINSMVPAIAEFLIKVEKNAPILERWNAVRLGPVFVDGRVDDWEEQTPESWWWRRRQEEEGVVLQKK